MAVILPNEAEDLLGDLIAARSLTVRLYTAVVGGVIDEATVLADFTEADFPGYAAVPVTPTTGWTVTTGDPTTLVANAAAVFTRSAAAGATDTILGYYVEDTVAGVIAWAEAAASSIDIAVENDAVSVTPALDLTDAQD